MDAEQEEEGTKAKGGGGKGRMRRTERGSHHQCASKNMLYIILKFPRILSPFCCFLCGCDIM